MKMYKIGENPIKGSIILVIYDPKNNIIYK